MHRHKIGQGQLRDIIYINFVELESLMLHAKIQDHFDIRFWKRRFVKVLAMSGPGGHLGHVNKTIFTKFVFPLSKEAPHNIWH